MEGGVPGAERVERGRGDGGVGRWCGRVEAGGLAGVAGGDDGEGLGGDGALGLVVADLCEVDEAEDERLEEGAGAERQGGEGDAVPQARKCGGDVGFFGAVRHAGTGLGHRGRYRRWGGAWGGAGRGWGGGRGGAGRAG